jgi:hypothetical protein
MALLVGSSLSVPRLPDDRSCENYRTEQAPLQSRDGRPTPRLAASSLYSVIRDTRLEVLVLCTLVDGNRMLNIAWLHGLSLSMWSALPSEAWQDRLGGSQSKTAHTKHPRGCSLCVLCPFKDL